MSLFPAYLEGTTSTDVKSKCITSTHIYIFYHYYLFNLTIALKMYYIMRIIIYSNFQSHLAIDMYYGNIILYFYSRINR